MLYKGSAKQFVEFLHSDDAIMATDTLEALAQTAKTDQENIPQDKLAFKSPRSVLHSCLTLTFFCENRKSQARLVKYALEGSEEQAKHAVIILSKMGNAEKVSGGLLKTLTDSLSAEDESLPSTLSALNQIALQLPLVFEASREQINRFIIQELLLASSPSESQEEDGEAAVDWVEYQDLPPFLRAKVLGLKLLINRVIPLAKQGDDSYRDGAKKVFKLLWRILEKDGELLAENASSAVCRSHLRLTAARGILKLAKADSSFDEMIDQLDFQKLALVIQDSCYQVREGFANRIIKYIQAGGLTSRYSVILMLAAHEPEQVLRHRIKLHLTRRAKALRQGEWRWLAKNREKQADGFDSIS